MANICYIYVYNITFALRKANKQTNKQIYVYI